MYKQLLFRVPVSINSGGSMLVCLKGVQCCVKKVWMVLKVPGEDIDWSSNRA